MFQWRFSLRTLESRRLIANDDFLTGTNQAPELGNPRIATDEGLKRNQISIIIIALKIYRVIQKLRPTLNFVIQKQIKITRCGYIQWTSTKSYYYIFLRKKKEIRE